MADPITLGALCGTALTNVVGGVIGNRSDAAFCGALNSLKNSFFDALELPENHELLKGVAAAHKRTLELMADTCSTQASDMAERFVADRMKAVAGKAFKNDPKAAMLAAQSLLDAVPRLLETARAGEAGARQAVLLGDACDGVIAWFEAESGETMPAHFVTIFRNGAANGRPAWWQTFQVCIAELIKGNDRFERILAATTLADVAGRVVNSEYVVFALRDGLDHVVAALDRIEGKIDLNHQEMLAAIEGLRSDLVAANPGMAQQAATMAETAIGLAESPDAERRDIAQAFVGDDPMAAATQLAALAEQEAERTAETFRQAGALAAPFDLKKAVSWYARSVELDPAHVWTWIALARLHMTTGSLVSARRCAEAALQHAVNDRDRMAAEIEFGKIAIAEGSLGVARARFAIARDIAKVRAAHEPGNMDWQRDLSVSHERLGDVARASGDLAGAGDAYQQSLTIRQQLAAHEPGNMDWQRDLSISHNKLGDVAQASGDLAGARHAYQQGLTIAQRLAAHEPDNMEWQRDLSISHQRLGDVAQASGDLAGARDAHQQGLTIAQRLAAHEPGNMEWQRDLSVSHTKLGDVAQASGDLAGARDAHQQGLTIAQRLAAHEPGNMEWQRDLSISHNKLGDVAEAMGDRDAAIAGYEASLLIAQRLADDWPDHPGFANDLAITERRLEALRAK
jgi:tetratricopeptide (TPR) repeat protein